MRTWLRNLIIIVLLILLIILIIVSAKPKNIVRLAGSTAFLPIAEKLGEIYQAAHPDVIIEVQGGGSAVGIMVALQGIADIGMVDMLTLPKETDKIEKIMVAQDGIAVVVNNTNKIDNISIKQLQAVFSGEVESWKDLGGADIPIRVVSREEGSGTRKSFDQLVLSAKRLTDKAMYQDSNGTIREAVKNDPNSIGYISIGFLDSSVKPLSIENIVASNDNVKIGKYKLSRPIYFLLKNNPSSRTQDFISFILGSDAQNIISKEGLIPVK